MILFNVFIPTKKADLLTAMSGHILQEGSIRGKYRRQAAAWDYFWLFSHAAPFCFKNSYFAADMTFRTFGDSVLGMRCRNFGCVKI
ncbi:hypothetical protein CLOHYLEM_07474 [[Clostridium] hylemonae DSM 15053]|uniref:Uncharacterized protein n=2 Tax=[Clostridium] hylemonae TaxID=89153 RepID=C0C5T7_9FIRM|nr:hypothetical protein CLOHYLEM_07474 [[Clostridium] hylemonae DSM 15053]